MSSITQFVDPFVAAAGRPPHATELENVLTELHTTRAGLTTEQSAERLREHGPNLVARIATDTALRILWRQINTSLIWVLVAAAALAITLGKVVDGLVVLAVVLLNALIGFVQEYRARDAIDALRIMVPENATLMRDGRSQSVGVAGLVPGDVVTLASGDRVPADLRLLHTKNLRIGEAALTGESLPVEKATSSVAHDAALGDRTCMAFSGTSVASGTGTGVVVATGSRTELGRISTMLSDAADLETPLTRALGLLGRQITVGISGVSVVMVVIGVARAMGAGLGLWDAAREVLLFAIALAVGAIPEGLPAIVTIALAIGVRRMAARHAIIRKLPAVETLGSTTIICTDKTGTLTRNEMTVREVWTPASGSFHVEGTGYAALGGFRRAGADGAGFLPADAVHLLERAVLCSDATLERGSAAPEITGDPTEVALIVAAHKAQVDVAKLRARTTRKDVIPFESEHRFMATLHEGSSGEGFVVLKGAPESVLPRLHGKAASVAAEAQRETGRLAAQGMRVLAIGGKAADHESLDFEHVEQGLELLGLVGMIDPPRAEARRAIEHCHSAGIAVKMITGDHHVTAHAIARELGLTDEQPALTGSALSGLSSAEFEGAARAVNVFARVAPEHKLRLVEALQAQGHIVAMTGDGVNDAPALKQANIGVAMGISGTSVTKEVADMVLVDDNFATIVAAVEEGRRVYDNLQKSLAFVLPTNLSLALIMIVAVVWFPFDVSAGILLLPIAPTQLLWINLVAAVALALPLAFEVKEPDIMARPPRDPGAPVLSGEIVVRTLVAALLMTAGVVWVFWWELGRYLDHGEAPLRALAEGQTMAVTTAIAFQAFYLLNCRSLRAGLMEIGLFSNPWVFGGISALAILQALFIYAPPWQALFGSASLGVADLCVSVAVGALALPIMACEKWVAGRRERARAGSVALRRK